MLKLNFNVDISDTDYVNSNTTLVKVKCKYQEVLHKSIFNSNTTLVKVKFPFGNFTLKDVPDSNTTLVKVKSMLRRKKNLAEIIQIQLLLKLNVMVSVLSICIKLHSNTTLVKVKLKGA